MTLSSLRRAAPAAAMLAAVALLSACASGGGVEASRHPAEPPIIFTPPPSAAAVALDHAAELGITGAGRDSLVAISRVLDSVNAPLRVRLDSLHPTRRPVNPRDLSQEQRDDIRTRREAVAVVMAQWREHDAATRPRVLALLSAEQQQKLLAWVDEERRNAESRAAEGRLDDDRRGRRGGRGG